MLKINFYLSGMFIYCSFC